MREQYRGFIKFHPRDRRKEEDKDENEDKIMEKIRVNVDRLEQIMEASEHTEEIDKRITHLQPKKILH